MVLFIFESLSSLVKLKGISTDNIVFMLHYKATVLFLAFSSLLITSTQYFGDPINCLFDSVAFESQYVNVHCWLENTFTLPDLSSKSGSKAVVGVDVSNPGVYQYIPGTKQPRIFTKYYQWVGVILFIQAIMFYLPRFLWKIWESGRLYSLIQNLNEVILDQKTRENEIRQLLEYFAFNRSHHNGYFFAFVVCELLNALNVCLQTYSLNAFFGFFDYGFEVFQFTQMNQKDRFDLMLQVFPRTAKCTLYDYGVSGDRQLHDVYCVLPLNNFNEKIFIFFWFWFVILSVVTGVMIGYRFLTILIKPLRKTPGSACALVLPNADHQLKVVFQASNIGDWFLLNLLAENIDGRNFDEFIARYAEYIQKETNVNVLNEDQDDDEEPQEKEKEAHWQQRQL